MASGIEAIAFHGPEHYLEMAELARARGVEPSKYEVGLGQKEMAVATPCEDTVTMAAEAGRAALANFAIDPASIGMLVVGTETGVDHSKPTAVYIHELLGLRANCRTFETKHACYGAMAGLTSATDWVLSGRARGSKALVIASDIARYGLGSAGEPTQGAGAVAMVLSDRPRLLEFDDGVTGDYTKQVMDFWRPLYSKVAFADGHYSIECYLDALSGALGAALSGAAERSAYAIARLAACFYHVPFAKMAKKAHTRHHEFELGRTLGKDAPENAAIAETYAAKVERWLSLNAVVGNIYTGSLFLALIDYLRNEAAREGDTVSLFSYGSGCGAAFTVARVGADAAACRPALDPSAALAARKRLSLDEYERFTTACETAGSHGDERFDPADWGLRGGLYYLGTEHHIRRYARM